MASRRAPSRVTVNSPLAPPSVAVSMLSVMLTTGGSSSLRRSTVAEGTPTTL